MDTFNSYYNMAGKALVVLIYDKYRDDNKELSDKAVFDLKRLKERMIQGNDLYKRKKYDLCYELFKNIDKDIRDDAFNLVTSQSVDQCHTEIYIAEYRKYIKFVVEILKAKIEEISNKVK